MDVPTEKETPEQRCEICNMEQSKYRCPKCGIHYCSVQCFKTHKESCEEKSFAVIKEEETKQIGVIEEEDSEDPDHLLESLIPKNQLSKIKESESIRELLNEPFIQKAIVAIMSSENKERTLNNLKNNSEMSLLIDELLLCVGVAKRREDGSIEFTGI